MIGHRGDFRGKPPEVAQLLPELLVGEYPRVEDVPWLRATHGVSAILSLQDDDDLFGKGLRLRDLERAYASEGITFRRHPVADYDLDALATTLPGALADLQSLFDAGHRVLVHCNAGYNRAPTLAVAYLHRHRGLTLAEAHAQMRKARACVPYMTVLEKLFGTR
jgi:hypothetical protein